MSLLKNINKSIEKTIVQFTKDISDKYGMSQDELIEMWENASKMKTKTVKSSSKRMSPWLQFCKNERAQLKSQQPNLKFGEISKLIGEKWSSLSNEDKEKYRSENTNVVVPSTPTTNTLSATTNKNDKRRKKDISTTDICSDQTKWTSENLKELTMPKLRDLCESVKLSKTGSKVELIDRLVNCSNDPFQTSNVSTSEITNKNKNDTSDLDSDQEEDTPCTFNYDYSSD